MESVDSEVNTNRPLCAVGFTAWHHSAVKRLTLYATRCFGPVSNLGLPGCIFIPLTQGVPAVSARYSQLFQSSIDPPSVLLLKHPHFRNGFYASG